MRKKIVYVVAIALLLIVALVVLYIINNPRYPEQDSRFPTSNSHGDGK